ncbi:MAG: DUF72 domain-containing protein [Janthinobacterium lividum]
MPPKKAPQRPLRIGTAGWSVARDHAEHFPGDGSHLERYSQVFRCVEINSSFHRSHRRSTWERWAATTPANFRFAVKMPKRITHEAKLRNTGALLLDFMQEISGLNAGAEPKLGPLLVQLPPKLVFDEGVVHEFLSTLRELHTGAVAVEPRHASWFTGEADRLLREFEAARVAADPAKASPLAAEPAGDVSLRYWRLHGSPRTYYSNYEDDFLSAFAQRLLADRKRLPASDVWVIFDNTALRHATANALQLQAATRT